MVNRETLERIRAALKCTEAVVRAESVDALAVLHDVRGLCAALVSADPYLRRRAVKVLAPLAGDWFTWRLVRLAFDADTQVRVAVAEALGVRRGWLALWALRHLAADAQPSVRYATLSGLARRGGRCARASLEFLATSDEATWVRDDAAALLAHRSGLGEE